MAFRIGRTTGSGHLHDLSAMHCSKSLGETSTDYVVERVSEKILPVFHQNSRLYRQRKLFWPAFRLGTGFFRVEDLCRSVPMKKYLLMAGLCCAVSQASGDHVRGRKNHPAPGIRHA